MKNCASHFFSSLFPVTTFTFERFTFVWSNACMKALSLIEKIQRDMTLVIKRELRIERHQQLLSTPLLYTFMHLISDLIVGNNSSITWLYTPTSTLNSLHPSIESIPHRSSIMNNETDSKEFFLFNIVQRLCDLRSTWWVIGVSCWVYAKALHEQTEEQTSWWLQSTRGISMAWWHIHPSKVPC